MTSTQSTKPIQAQLRALRAQAKREYQLGGDQAAAGTIAKIESLKAEWARVAQSQYAAPVDPAPAAVDTGRTHGPALEDYLRNAWIAWLADQTKATAAQMIRAKNALEDAVGPRRALDIADALFAEISDDDARRKATRAQAWDKVHEISGHISALCARRNETLPLSTERARLTDQIERLIAQRNRVYDTHRLAH